MRTRNHALLLSTIVAAGILAGAAHGQNVIKSSPADVGSGLNPQGGQINPGVAVQAPAGSPPGMNDQSGQGAKVGDRAPDVRNTAATNEKIPSAKEARAALLGPVFKDPLPGEGPAPAAPTPTAGDAKKVTGQGSPSPTDASSGHAAIGGALSPGASGAASGGSSGSQGGGGQQAGTGQQDAQQGNTVGGGGNPQSASSQPSAPQPRGNAGDEPRLGPIGSIGQTIPAKFSKRNDTLDRVPTMAWPLAISDEQRQQVYQIVMSDKSSSIDVSKLQPTDQLPASMALDNMHPLPDSAAKIGDLDQLAYVKGKDKVLLVIPSTRIIVDVIASQS